MKTSTDGHLVYQTKGTVRSAWSGYRITLNSTSPQWFANRRYKVRWTDGRISPDERCFLCDRGWSLGFSGRLPDGVEVGQEHWLLFRTDPQGSHETNEPSVYIGEPIFPIKETEPADTLSAPERDLPGWVYGLGFIALYLLTGLVAGTIGGA